MGIFLVAVSEKKSKLIKYEAVLCGMALVMPKSMGAWQ